MLQSKQFFPLTLLIFYFEHKKKVKKFPAHKDRRVLSEQQHNM